MEELRYMQSKWLYGFALVAQLVEELGLSPDKHVLYLGCGFGKMLEYLVQRFGCKITATDISRIAVTKTQTRILKGPWKSRISVRDFEDDNLISENETFDFTLIETLIPFVRGRERAVESYAKALKRGGKMGILELVWVRKPPEQLRERIGVKFGLEVDIPNDQELRTLFGKAGLRLYSGRIYHLSMLQKVLDDFRYNAYESLLDLLETLNTIFRDPVTRQIALDFLRFYREYPKFLGIVKYIYLKP